MGQGVVDNPAPAKKVSEILEEGWVYFHLIGMTHQEYWFERTELVYHYRQLDLLKQKRDNERDWRLGAYIYSALISVSPVFNALAKKPKPLPYMEKPFPVSEEEVIKNEDNKIEKRHNDFLNYLHKVAKKSGGRK